MENMWFAKTKILLEVELFNPNLVILPLSYHLGARGKGKWLSPSSLIKMDRQNHLPYITTELVDA